ncbi:MAG: hypothetical protein LAP21_19505 [Acidobacteriia bacterium]|nr:hypothetical protein [Terriglobia bacterium]
MTTIPLPTLFAPAERESPGEVCTQSEKIAQTPHIGVLLDCIAAPAMIVNGARQLVAANQQLTKLLRHPQEMLIGLRLGEMFNCIHGNEEPAGCGTTIYCRACGGVKALLNSWNGSVPDAQDCRMVRGTQLGMQVLDLHVTATPLFIDGQHFTVVVLTDICRQPFLRQDPFAEDGSDFGE